MEGETVMEKDFSRVVVLTLLLGMILLERVTRLQVLEGGEFLQCEVSNQIVMFDNLCIQKMRFPDIS